LDAKRKPDFKSNSTYRKNVSDQTRAILAMDARRNKQRNVESVSGQFSAPYAAIAPQSSDSESDIKDNNDKGQGKKRFISNSEKQLDDIRENVLRGLSSSGSLKMNYFLVSF
jgi:hypothetical protein